MIKVYSESDEKFIKLVNQLNKYTSESWYQYIYSEFKTDTESFGRVESKEGSVDYAIKHGNSISEAELKLFLSVFKI